MNNASLVVAFADFVAVGIYLFLGWRFSQRPVSPESRLPVLQFSLFWLGLALVTFIGGIESAVAAFVTPSLPLVVTLYYVEILLLCAVLWGLVGYLVHLYTGRSFLAPLTALYALLYVLLVYFITASGPDAVTVTLGAVGVRYATPVGGPILGLLVLILIVPEFLGAFLYFTLFFRTQDRTARYRIALVSWGLVAFFGVGSVGVATRLGGGLGAVTLGAVLGIVPALVILVAYYPPRLVRERLRVTGIEVVTRPLGR
ncbi:MAG: hypothetical protein WA688_04010 [Thermoplasmata archaeon]